jgi:hypothetical protein
MVSKATVKLRNNSWKQECVLSFNMGWQHVDELSSAQIGQHKLCATLSANVNINYHLPIKVYYRICTL